MVAYGNLTLDGTNLAFSGFLSDVHNPAAPLALQKIYRGAATDVDARRLAHQFADDIIGILSGGQAGIAQTADRIRQRATGNEIWLMDYDGANQHQLSHLKSIALTPRWSPDATRVAFTCYEPWRGVTSAQICIYSTSSDRLIAFPGIAPERIQLPLHSLQTAPKLRSCPVKTATRRFMFPMPVARIFIASRSPRASVLHLRGIPRPGKQIVFVSDRGGDPVLYLANSDGSNVEKLGHAGHGLRRRSRVVAKWTADRVQLATPGAATTISTSWTL